MRVLIQRFATGEVELQAAPAPAPGRAEVLVATQASLISAGTERMLIDFGRANLLAKARQQPHRVAEVLGKVQTDGLAATVGAVRTKLAAPTTLGYASAGRVLQVGSDVQGFEVGDAVATNGPHAEIATIPQTFVAASEVPAEHGCFASVAAVALEGIRLGDAELGSNVVVVGLGLVGLLTVQLLRANGCRVLGIDVNAERLERAAGMGADVQLAGDAAVPAADRFSRGRGVDAVLLCLSTASSEPVHQAAQMCRRRGRVVLVGVAGLELDRADFYDKELSFHVSCSYGPGRYDPVYEAGADYPIGHVRWTAGRNMEAAVDLMATGALDVDSLITHRFDFDDATGAYDALLNDPASLGIVLRYPDPPESAQPNLRRDVVHAGSPAISSAARVGVLGAGGFASQVLIPAFREAGAQLEVVASRRGTSAAIAAEQHAVARSTSDPDAVIADPDVDTVVIATRHDSHAAYVEASLRAGKAVFVEKPIAVDDDQLDRLVACHNELAAAGSVPAVGIGFNRRFAPITVRMRELMAPHAGPKSLVLLMNAGALPADHWTNDAVAGGGRIIGEACHMVDLARHLVGAPIVESQGQFMASSTSDTASIGLTFADGSIATVHYFANGSKRFPKERIEVFVDGRVLRNDNFRRLDAIGFGRKHGVWSRRQDKGHAAGVNAFVDAVRTGGAAPIPFEEIIEVHRATFAAARSSWTGAPPS